MTLTSPTTIKFKAQGNRARSAASWLSLSATGVRPLEPLCVRLRFQKHPGFTLIEILLVVFIVGMMAVMVLPRNTFSFVTPLRAMQRAITEITDMAMGGYSVRLRVDAADRADRGRLVAEALTKAENNAGSANGMLEWLPVSISNLPEGEGWRLEPELLYFYSDGSCTPGRVMYADDGKRITEGDLAMLTVTGFLFEPEMDEVRR